jgi:hypothetical protein
MVEASQDLHQFVQLDRLSGFSSASFLVQYTPTDRSPAHLVEFDHRMHTSSHPQSLFPNPREGQEEVPSCILLGFVN